MLFVVFSFFLTQNYFQDHVLLLIPTCTTTDITAARQTGKNIIDLKVPNVTEVSSIDPVFVVLGINTRSVLAAFVVTTGEHQGNLLEVDS